LRTRLSSSEMERSNLRHSLVAIVGPTAVGKSELALSIARDLKAEIVTADSRQVYRHMDIGTNKPTLAERASVPHHLIDVVDPDSDFSLALYCRLATEAIKSIRLRGKLALLVGGSGLSIWSLIEGWKIPPVPANVELRAHMEARAEREGSHILYQELQDVDPLAAAKIHPSNARRIIRGLEIYHETGQLPSRLRRKEAPDFHSLIIGLTMARSELYNRIDNRVDNMIDRGFIDEVKGLLGMGYNLSLPSMSGIGYRQIGQFLKGEMFLPAAIDKMKSETHRLARHQYAWFRLNDKRIHWLNVDNSTAEASNLIGNFCDELV
jgi:tRNA dimethylallyltransferase